MVLIEKDVELLRLVPFSSQSVIPATDGTLNFVQAKKLGFRLGPDVDILQLDVPGCRAKAREVKVYKLVRAADFKQMFSEIRQVSSALCFTQHQIISFCCEYGQLLNQEGFSNFFLFKLEGEKRVACVRQVTSSKLNKPRVYIYGYNHEHVWCGDWGHRIIVPSFSP